MADWLDEFMAKEGLGEGFLETYREICVPLADRAARLRQVRRRTLTFGICGPQGSGKSTIAAVIVHLLRERGLKAVALSLDDFYLSRQARERLAADIHPLLATRGPPGTHDPRLAGAVIDQLKAKGRVALPVFDKAADNPLPRGRWETIVTPVDVIIFEGWCIGAQAQGDGALRTPVNNLERDEDPDGVWRTYVNDQLDGPYKTLFERLNQLILLQPPGFEVVQRWRAEQEHKLRARTGAGMDDAELTRFIAHYERLTRHILNEMPERANWVAPLDADRRPIPEMQPLP